MRFSISELVLDILSKNSAQWSLSISPTIYEQWRSDIDTATIAHKSTRLVST